MQKRVAEYIRRYRLLSPDRLQLVALSGGADSVALLRVLLLLGYRVEAIHCNFHLRGEESDRDEHFADQLCQKWGVTLHRVHFDTRTYAELHHLSIELAARELRYRYFEQLRKDVDAERVCVAHHRDDQVETVLMNMVRGTGIHGMTGMKPLNGCIARPLLAVSREDIIRWLQLLGQDYVTDSTNLTDEATRNRFRHHLVPLLQSFNPSFSEHVAQLAERMQDAEQLFNQAVDRLKEDVCTKDEHSQTLRISLAALQTQDTWRTLLYEWLHGLGFSRTQVEDMSALIAALPATDKTDSLTGRMFSSATHDALFNRGFLLVERHAPSLPLLRIPEWGTYVYRVADDDASCPRLRLSMQPLTDAFTPSRDTFRITLDADKIRFPLFLRPVAEGDRLIPFGMKGFKLVSDYLTDRKRSLFEKRRQLVLADAQGQILWLVGERTDNRYRIGGETKTVAVIDFLSSPTASRS